jgi:DNA-binding transcriptional ArsR family regulator
MKSKHPENYLIRKPSQIRALSAAARQEVIDVLASVGTVSVAELAATLGRPADALYFHLRALMKVGLVRQDGYRKGRGARKEALFRAVAPELRLHYEPNDELNRKGVTAIVSSMLRLGIRDFQRAFERGDVIVSGSERELWALRTTGRMSLDQIAGINRGIQDLKLKISRPQQGGRLYGLTILLTPLDHRQRKEGAKSKRKGAKTK